jgi:hypothetical protein
VFAQKVKVLIALLPAVVLILVAGVAYATNNGARTRAPAEARAARTRVMPTLMSEAKTKTLMSQATSMGRAIPKTTMGRARPKMEMGRATTTGQATTMGRVMTKAPGIPAVSPPRSPPRSPPSLVSPSLTRVVQFFLRQGPRCWSVRVS